MGDPMENIRTLNEKIELVTKCMAIVESQMEDLKLLAVHKKKTGQDKLFKMTLT